MSSRNVTVKLEGATKKGSVNFSQGANTYARLVTYANNKPVRNYCDLCKKPIYSLTEVKYVSAISTVATICQNCEHVDSYAVQVTSDVSYVQ